MTKAEQSLPLVLWLLVSGCHDCMDEEIVEFTLDAEHPAVLIRASLDGAEAPQIMYVGDDGWLETDAEAPCRVAIYNYGGELVPSEWPSPGDSPTTEVVIDRDFVISADAPAAWIGKDIIEFGAGPTSGSLLITSCGTAQIRGRLRVASCVDEGDHIDVEIRTTPDG